MVASLLALDPDGPTARDLIRTLVSKRVALTSTLPVFETFTPGRPPATSGPLDAMLPEAANIADVEHVELVFKDGTGYDPAKLIAAAQGSVGWR